MSEAIDQIRMDSRIVRWVAYETQTFETSEDFLEHDAAFDSGQVRTQAEMRTTSAERNMIVRVAAHID
jgi:hypothetical protein